MAKTHSKMFLHCVLFVALFNAFQINAQSQFANDILSAHNTYRAKHGVPPVSLDSSISAYAQDWANNLASRNVMEHRPNNKYGENIYASTGTPNGASAVKSFYDEIKDYDYNKPGFSYKTGHFTQVIWKNSKKIGVGIAKGKQWTYVVVNYDPPGNYQGQFPQNVPRPL